MPSHSEVDALASRATGGAEQAAADEIVVLEPHVAGARRYHAQAAVGCELDEGIGLSVKEQDAVLVGGNEGPGIRGQLQRRANAERLIRASSGGTELDGGEPSAAARVDRAAQDQAEPAIMAMSSHAATRVLEQTS